MECQNPNPSSVLIVHHQSDHAFFLQLDSHLSSIRRTSQVRTWAVSQVDPGVDLQKGIDTELQTATLMLILLSADLLNSDSFVELVARGLQKQVAGHLLVVAVIVRSCIWQYPPFSRLPILPSNTIPVQNWPLVDDAWTDVVSGVARALRQLGRSGEDLEVRDELQAIQQAVLRARNVSELKHCMFRISEYVRKHPANYGAWLLKDQVTNALAHEARLQRSARAAAWSVALPHLPTYRHLYGPLGASVAVLAIAVAISLAINYPFGGQRFSPECKRWLDNERIMAAWDTEARGLTGREWGTLLRSSLESLKLSSDPKAEADRNNVVSALTVLILVDKVSPGNDEIHRILNGLREAIRRHVGGCTQ